MKLTEEEIKKHSEMANAIRFLSADAVQNANSGHPGMPMGFAEVATILFSYHLKFDPRNPDWANRDRFILSAGHGSMLLYSILYLLNYPKIELNDIKNFRKLGYPTAGHPEHGEIPGIETTTGPLGQGLGNGLGIAISEKLMRERLGKEVINHFTYVVAGDGCIMEGISHEFASLAGHLSLSNLIVLYDDNKISIDGPTSITMSDNTLGRFESMGWHTEKTNGYDLNNINKAISNAKLDNRPSIISFETEIGFGSPSKQGKASSHGAPLGKEELLKAKDNLNWKHEAFEVPDKILKYWSDLSKKYINEFNSWTKNHGEKVANLAKNKTLKKETIIEARKKLIGTFLQNNKLIATRKSSELVIGEFINKKLNLLGGSADLTGSNNTIVEEMVKIKPSDFSGNYLHWGVREHCMAAAMNGISLHGFFVPYGGTFLVFSDYCRPAIRLSALMKQQVIYVFTHDSIGLGEDGPTHQPIEHLSSLRAIPNVKIFRPCDSIETAECWELALLNNNGPSVLALSRQNLEQLRNKSFDLFKNYTSDGAYEIRKHDNSDITFVSSGSEVQLAVEASNELLKDNIKARVISVPCIENITQENADKIFKKSKNIFIEAGIRLSWDRFMNEKDIFIGMSSFGASGPAKDLYKNFNITKDRIITEAKNLINKEGD